MRWLYANYSLVWLDINNLKIINDRYGHEDETRHGITGKIDAVVVENFNMKEMS